MPSGGFHENMSIIFLTGVEFKKKKYPAVFAVFNPRSECRNN